MKGRYTRGEAEFLIDRAQRMQTEDELSEEDLMAGAEGIGLPAAAVRIAETTFLLEKRVEEQALAYRKKVRAERLKKLIPNLLLFSCLMAIIIPVNFITVSFPWSLMLAGPWAALLAWEYFKPIS